MSKTTRSISETIHSVQQIYHHTRSADGTTQPDTQEVTDSDNAPGNSWTVEEFMTIMNELLALNVKPDVEHNEGVDEVSPNDRAEDFDENFDSDFDSDIESEHLNDSAYEAICKFCVDTTDTQELPCCSVQICEECLRTYFGVELMAGKGKIRCPMCSTPLGDDFVDGYLSDDSKVRLNQNKVDSTRDPNIKTCPRCKLVTNRSEVPNVSKGSNGMPVTCTKCDFQWCFECHGPYHEGKTCSRATEEGDAQLKRWAKHYKNSQKNARRCPGCKAYVQRSDGCDHMDCKCGTDFCYKCGKPRDITNIRRGICTCDRTRDRKQVAILAAIGSGVVLGGIVALPIIVGVGAASIPIIPVALGVRIIQQAIKKKRRRNRKDDMHYWRTDVLAYWAIARGETHSVLI